VIRIDEHYQRPDWVRRLNYMGDAVLGAHRLVSLDPDGIVAQAQEATGLDDFGDVDGDWRGRFERLVEEIERTGNLHVVGRLMTRQELLRGLISRLLLAQRRRAVPAIAQEKIEKPIVIAGPGRSGTTILHELLWLDPEARSAPRLRVAPARAADRRHGGRPPARGRVRAGAVVRRAARVRGDPRAAAHLPMECIAIQQPSFGGYHWAMAVDVPGYALDSSRDGLPPRGAAEPPTRCAAPDLGAQDARLPDDARPALRDVSRRVRDHDPPRSVKTIPSGISTLATVRWLRSDHVDLAKMDGYGSGILLHMLVQRDQAGTLPGRLAHVHFADLMRDPVATIERLYDGLGGSSRRSTPTRSATTSRTSRRASSARTSTSPRTGASIPRGSAATSHRTWPTTAWRARTSGPLRYIDRR
jgi:hypothetical protein